MLNYNHSCGVTPFDRDQTSFICDVCGKRHDIEEMSPDYEGKCLECAIEKNTDECYECGEWFYSPVSLDKVVFSRCPKCLKQITKEVK